MGDRKSEKEIFLDLLRGFFGLGRKEMEIKILLR